MKKKRLEVVFKLDSISHLQTWNLIYSKLQTIYPINIKVSLYDKNLLLSKVNDAIKKSSKSHFGVETEDYSIHFGSVTNYNHILLRINEKKVPPISLTDWAESFIVLEGFIQAWVSDTEYYYWQNATDPIQYNTKGLSYDRLPMKSNGLPYPLEQMVIDTSSNPCFREIKGGYVEAIGTPMWLSDLFWKHSANSKEYVIKELDGKAKELNKVVYIKIIDEPFEDESTVEKQKELRKLLYG